MDSSFAAEQDTCLIGAQASSPISLIRRGLDCLSSGRYGEGIFLLAQAREGLSSDQMLFASLLDTFAQGLASYCQAQEALLEASRRFAKVDTEQQARLAALEKLLSTLEKNVDAVSDTVAQLVTNSQHAQISPLRLSRKEHEPYQLFPPSQLPSEDSTVLPDLSITCFGSFEVRRYNQPIVLCHNRSGQAILRYLVAQPGHRATMDKLMTLLWPEEEPEVARRKLQVAVSALRRCLNSGYDSDPGGGYILFRDRVYQLNPAISFRSDVDEFQRLYKAGQHSSESETVIQYELACDLYIGPFLVEDMYADWPFVLREQLSETYLTMCNTLSEYYLTIGRYEDVVKWASAILKESSCDEAAHRQLIRAYAAQGRRSEALRQYHRCEHILLEELGVSPMPETVQLCRVILMDEYDPSLPYRAKIERK